MNGRSVIIFHRLLNGYANETFASRVIWSVQVFEHGIRDGFSESFEPVAY